MVGTQGAVRLEEKEGDVMSEVDSLDRPREKAAIKAESRVQLQHLQQSFGDMAEVRPTRTQRHAFLTVYSSLAGAVGRGAEAL